MAIVRKLEHVNLDRDSKHTEVNCTYSIVTDGEGKKHLQIDTYGSATRKIPGKKNQSICFDSVAIRQRKSIIDKEF